MKKSLTLFIIILYLSFISLFSSDNNFSWQGVVTSLVITTECFEESRKVFSKLQQQCVVRRVYRGVDNSEYVTIEFAENWVKNFRRMRAQELRLYRAEIVRLLEQLVDDQSIQVYRNIIRQRQEEADGTFLDFLMRYQGNFVQLKFDIDATERNLFGRLY